MAVFVQRHEILQLLDRGEIGRHGGSVPARLLFGGLGFDHAGVQFIDMGHQQPPVLQTQQV